MAADNEINVKITATTDDIESGMKRAADSVKDFGDAAEQNVSRVSDAVRDNLNKGILTAARGVAQPLGEISTQAKTAAESVETLGAGAHLSAGGMRELVVVGRELASGNFTRLPGSLSILATRLGGISPAAILGAAGIAAFAYAIYEAIDSGEKFQKELTSIQLVMNASGRGDSYNADFVTQLINNFRQATDVTREQAEEMTHAFASIRTLGEADLQTISQALISYKSVVGETTEQAAKDLQKAFGGDTLRYIEDLSKQWGVYTPAQLEAAKAAKAMGDQATLTKIAMQGFLDVAGNTTGENATGLAKYFNDIGEGLDGISVRAKHARDALLAAAEAADKTGNTEGAKDFRYRASAYESPTRNLPGYVPSAASGESTGKAIDNSAAAQRAKQQQELNDAIKDGNELADRSNAPLIEQQNHLRQITRLQIDLNAAIKQAADGTTPQDKQSGADAAPKIQAAIDQENKQYAERMKRQQPKPDRTDDEFNSLIDEEAEKGARDQAQQAQARIESSAKVGEAQVKTAEETAKQEYELGQTTAEQELATLTALAVKSNAIEQSRFDQLATLYQNDAAKYAEITAQKAEAEQKYQQTIQQLQTQASKRERADQQQQEQAFAQSAQKLIGPWENALNNMGTRTRVWQQATIQAEKQVQSNLVSNVSTMVANWLLGEQEKSAATAIGAKFRQLTQKQGSSQAVQDNITNTEKNQLTDAVGVFTNVFNYLSPELGPFAAVPAAAASAAVLALSLPSAAGGMIVPSDTLAMVHQNEMVLPARYTGGLTKMIDGANAGASGATHNFNNTFHVNAGDGLTAKQLPDMIVKTMSKAMRNGLFGAMRTT